VRGLERIPRTGRVTLVANHPTGLADGVALYDAVKEARSDICFFANSDALRVNRRLSDIFIPVEWVPAKRTRERTRLTLALANEAYAQERALAIFPAGAIALPDRDLRLIDPPWQPTAISLARKHDSPILPVHVSGPISWAFALLHRVSKELRDVTLFHDLLNKAGCRFDVIFGPPILRPETLDGDSGALGEALKLYVERTLPDHPDRPFA
jgi:putative hemolysin